MRGAATEIRTSLFFFNDTATTEIYTLSLHDVFRSPTAGTTRFAGALTLADFTRDIHLITADRSALLRLAPHVVALAGAEGLDAHAESVRLRVVEAERSEDG